MGRTYTLVECVQEKKKKAVTKSLEFNAAGHILAIVKDSYFNHRSVQNLNPLILLFTFLVSDPCCSLGSSQLGTFYCSHISKAFLAFSKHFRRKRKVTLFDKIPVATGKKYLITTVAVELLHFCNTVPNLFCTWSFRDSVYEFLHQSPETSSAVSYRQRLCWNIFLSVLAIALCCVVQQQHFAYKC